VTKQCQMPWTGAGREGEREDVVGEAWLGSVLYVCRPAVGVQGHASQGPHQRERERQRDAQTGREKAQHTRCVAVRGPLSSRSGCVAVKGQRTRACQPKINRGKHMHKYKKQTTRNNQTTKQHNTRKRRPNSLFLFLFLFSNSVILLVVISSVNLFLSSQPLGVPKDHGGPRDQGGRKEVFPPLVRLKSHQYLVPQKLRRLCPGWVCALGFGNIPWLPKEGHCIPRRGHSHLAIRPLIWQRSKVSEGRWKPEQICCRARQYFEQTYSKITQPVFPFFSALYALVCFICARAVHMGVDHRLKHGPQTLEPEWATPQPVCVRRDTTRKSRTTPRDWFKCTRPEHPAHGGVMLCTVQCRPASACARKSPPRGCTLKKQDKTRHERPRCLPIEHHELELATRPPKPNTLTQTFS